MTETTTPRTVDKKGWADGPWMTEPDYVRFDHLGLPCILARADQSGHWCGYVGVPPGHPWHGKDDCNAPDCEVHGGITYGRACSHDVCHVPKPGESENVWWLGFDCAHAGDVSPGYLHLSSHRRLSLGGRFPDTYKTEGWVRAQTTALARQARIAQGWTTIG